MRMWPAMAHVLHMPLSAIDELTVDEFDAAVEYVEKTLGGGRGQ